MDGVDLEVLRSAVNWLDAGQRVCLVTVVRTYGSSPRPVGALLAVAGDGRFVGSVSGGCLEDDLIERLATNPPAQPEVLRYGVAVAEARRLGLPCGGSLQLVVEPVRSTDSLCTALAAVRARRIIRRRLHLPSGLAQIVTGGDGELRFDEETLVSVYGPSWRLLIIGAGQTSAYLARMAQALDFRVLLCDPRDEYAQGWAVAGTECLPGMPDEVVRTIAPDRRTAIVTLTHEPALDDLALLAALVSDAFYVGALGSRASHAKRRRRLAEHFDLTPEQLARLHGPVGLPIGSRTPPEIAVAILAELVAERNGKRAALALYADRGSGIAAATA